MTELVTLGAGGICRGTARLVSAANSDNATLAADRACDLHQIIGYNASASARYLKLYDKATAPASTDTPKITIYLPASLPFNIPFPPLGFVNGFGYRLVTGSADNDGTAVTAADILALNFMFAG